MYKLEPDPKVMKAASIVAESSRLREVRLSTVKVENRLDAESSPDGLFPELGYGLVGFKISPKNVLGVEVGVRLFIGKKAQSGSVLAEMKECPEGGIMIELSLVGDYELPDGPIPDEAMKEGIPAFASLNGLYNCWPYFRQHLQYLTSSMGLPAFNLGPLIVRAKTHESDEPEPCGE